MPEETLVTIAISVPTKQLIDQLKVSLTYTQFIEKLILENDSE
jgi:hypothetical protein